MEGVHVRPNLSRYDQRANGKVRGPHSPSRAHPQWHKDLEVGQLKVSRPPSNSTLEAKPWTCELTGHLSNCSKRPGKTETEGREGGGRQGRRESEERPSRDLNLTVFEKNKTKTKQDPTPTPPHTCKRCLKWSGIVNWAAVRTRTFWLAMRSGSIYRQKNGIGQKDSLIGYNATILFESANPYNGLNLCCWTCQKHSWRNELPLVQTAPYWFGVLGPGQECHPNPWPTTVDFIYW